MKSAQLRKTVLEKLIPCLFFCSQGIDRKQPMLRYVISRFYAKTVCHCFERRKGIANIPPTQTSADVNVSWLAAVRILNLFYKHYV